MVDRLLWRRKITLVIPGASFSGGSMKRAIYVFLMLLAVAGRAKADPIIGVNFDGDAFLIDSSTGTGTLLGPTGFFFLNSMAKNSSGVIYTQGSLDGFSSELLTINPNTGAATVVA